MLKTRLKAQHTVAPVPQNEQLFERIFWSDNQETWSNGRKIWLLILLRMEQIRAYRSSSWKQYRRIWLAISCVLTVQQSTLF